MNRPNLVFTLPEYRGMQATLCAAGHEPGEFEVDHFPDGERYLRIATPVDGREVVLVGGTTSDAATLTLFDLGCAIVRYGARRLTLVLPYYGYATMERAVRPGEVVTAKTRAALFSAIPPASYGNRILLLDLHAEGIPHYFEGSMTAFHVYAKPVLRRVITELGRRDGPAGGDFVVACTDAGRAKWVESLANDVGVTAAFVFKRRHDGSRTEVSALDAQVQGKRVVVYDDMIRTGGSLLGAARAYLRAGAASLAAVTTHGVFPGDALKKIRDAGVFTDIVCTDSHPRALELADQGLVVEPVAALFLPYL
ncbi:MAG: ribose-phosphate pyrophosphokinase [Myxococcales bacterium]|nr:ribose-phosphate pyrophosphokinase [Myxococcales bacterium]